MTEPAAPAVPRARAALAGVAAAGAALGVGELVSALNGPDQSLVAGVGTEFVNLFAASLKDFAVRTFGTNDKAALVVGIVVVSLAIGALVGLGAARRRVVGPLGFAAFGLLGIYAGFQDSQASRGLTVLAAGGATIAGALVLDALLRAAATGSPRALDTAESIEYPSNPAATRRAFFGWAGSAGAFAIVVGAAARALSSRSAVEAARSAVKLPQPVQRTPGPVGTGGTTRPMPTVASLDVDGITPYFMPNDSFYKIDTALITPQVDPATWKLEVNGMVDHPFSLTFDELLALPQVEESVTLSCVSNDVGGEYVGNALWQGVPLATLLDRAGVQSGATQIVSTSVDGWDCGFPTEAARDGRVAMIAVGMNGEALPLAHGFPARMVVAGLYGYVSATKWLATITLARWEDFDGYWIPRGWSKEGPIKTQSRIDVPRRAHVPAGPTKIAGIAWAPTRGISKVEVQVDDGEWRAAKLGDVLSANTWVQWAIDWNAETGQHLVRVRATDGTGQTQTSDVTEPAPDGATGWHTRSITVE